MIQWSKKSAIEAYLQKKKAQLFLKWKHNVGLTLTDFAIHQISPGKGVPNAAVFVGPWGCQKRPWLKASHLVLRHSSLWHVTYQQYFIKSCHKLVTSFILSDTALKCSSESKGVQKSLTCPVSTFCKATPMFYRFFWSFVVFLSFPRFFDV